MCGIAGIQLAAGFFEDGDGPFGGEEDALRNVTGQMITRLDHRGPDDRGAVIRRGRKSVTSLGHTRLSILDLSPAGHQPMHSNDGRLWLTYNGEIYNFKNLRDELSGAGETWNSQTDTEVLLRGYQRWGIDCLQRLRGMFAFGIWDDPAERLVLARDPFGIKPLYYYANDNTLIFASEVTALLATGLIPRKVSPEGIASFLHYGSFSSPLTIVQGVKSLQAGHYLVVETGADHLQTREVSYTEDLSHRTSVKQISDRREAVETLRLKLEESIRLHLVSDVDLGVFLSGGIDSSAIVSLMSQVSGVKPKTFSVTFAEDKFNESSYALAVAKKFGTDHHEIPLSQQDLFEMLPGALAALDQPTMDGVNSYVISAAVKQAGMTVALSGLGGDELFAGYPSFRRWRRLKKYGSIPSPLRRMTARIGRAALGGSVQRIKAWDLLSGEATAWNTYTISRRLFTEDEADVLSGRSAMFSRVLPASLSPAKRSLSDSLNDMSQYEMQGYMENTLLRDTDQMSMAHSLEVRVPFIDVDVVRFVMGLPGAWKMNGGRPKPLLQDALGGLLPDEVKNRPKMGFAIPFEKWMRSRLQGEIEGTLSDGKLFESIGFEARAVTELWRRFLHAPRSIGWSRPWALYVLGRWCAEHQVTL